MSSYAQQLCTIWCLPGRLRFSLFYSATKYSITNLTEYETCGNRTHLLKYLTAEDIYIKLCNVYVPYLKWSCIVREMDHTFFINVVANWSTSSSMHTVATYVFIKLRAYRRWNFQMRAKHELTALAVRLRIFF